MSDKKDAALTIGFLCAIMLVILAADLIQPDRIFSANENRLLASRPALTWETLISGDFMEDYETYITDQFASRDNWIELKTESEILTGRKEVGGVYLGEDDYLLEQHLPENYSDELINQKLELLNNLVKNYGARVMLVPTADNILSEKLPPYAPYFDQKTFLEQVRETVGDRSYIDVFSALEEHKEEQIYYRTDHHWTTLGAYYGYLAWKEHTGLLSPVHFVPDNMITVTEDFLGTLHSKINIPMKGEPIRCFEETMLRPVTVTYDYNVVKDTMYEASYLEGKNQYGYFLDENHGFIEIETGYKNGKELFILKDSYANCLIPLLTVHYERIYVADLRYYNGRLSQLMDPYMGENTDVLVLYNCIHFLEEFRYIQ